MKCFIMVNKREREKKGSDATRKLGPVLMDQYRSYYLLGILGILGCIMLQHPLWVWVLSQSRRAKGEPFVGPYGSAGLLLCLLRESKHV